MKWVILSFVLSAASIRHNPFIGFVHVLGRKNTFRPVVPFFFSNRRIHTTMASANGWSLHTPVMDLHHQVCNHARHTKKSAPKNLSERFYL